MKVEFYMNLAEINETLNNRGVLILKYLYPDWSMYTRNWVSISPYFTTGGSIEKSPLNRIISEKFN